MIVYQTDFPDWDVPWPAEWTTSASNGYATQQSTWGVLGFTDVASANVRAELAGVDLGGTVELTFRRVLFSDNNARSYFDIWFGSGGWAGTYRPVDGCGIEFRSDAGTAVVQTVTGGTVTTLTTVTGLQMLGPTSVGRLRMRLEGGQLQFKLWNDPNEPEPESWHGPFSVGVPVGTNHLFLAHNRAGSNVGDREVQIKELTLDDLQPDPPASVVFDDLIDGEYLMPVELNPQPPRTTSGTVAGCRRFSAVSVDSPDDAVVELRDGTVGGKVVAVARCPAGQSRVVGFAGGEINTVGDVYVNIVSGTPRVIVYKI